MAAQAGRRLLHIHRRPSFKVTLQLLQAPGRQREADSVRMAPEAGEELLAPLDRVEKMKAGNRPSGAVHLPILERNHDSRTAHTIDHSRGQDANDAAMPSFSFDHDATACLEDRFFAQAAIYLCEHGGFGLLPLAVQTVEFCG